MAPQQIVVLGGGFAGLWSAVGAARKLDELRIGPEAVTVTLVNRDSFHNIRVRNYESDLSSVRVALDDVLRPIGVRREEADVARVDVAERTVTLATAGGERNLPYDRLVFALGSQLVRPNLPGLAEHAFDVDTYAGAARLNAHLQSLCRRAESPGPLTVMVVGAGLTGIEVATEMPDRLQAALRQANIERPIRVLLVDHNTHVGSDMGEAARPVIEAALSALGIETQLGVRVASIEPDCVTLESGQRIPTSTVVWCAGMLANPLTRCIPVDRDRFGRVAVDEFLRVKDVPAVFAAGDVAAAMMDDRHLSVMSCQHGRPMGRFAGHNVVCDLLGLPMLPLRIEWYVTVLDLGSWGGVVHRGMGSARSGHRPERQANETNDQLRADLSAAIRRPAGNPCRRGARRAIASGDVSRGERDLTHAPCQWSAAGLQRIEPSRRVHRAAF